MSEFTAILSFAVVTEALTEAISRIWDKLPTQIVAMFWGVVMALLCDIDLIDMLGVGQRIPYVGCVVTGILLSRGSNYLHEFVSRLDK